MLKPRTYLFITFGVMATCFMVFGTMQIMADPFGIFRIYNKYGWNLHKPDYHLHTRQAKPLQAIFRRPEVIFFGSSRMEYLAPDVFLSKTDTRNMFNFGLSSCTPLDNYYLTLFSTSRLPVREAWFALDFYSYTGSIPFFYEGLDTSLLAGDKSILFAGLPLVLSWDADKKRKTCIELNLADPEGKTIDYHYNNNGSRKSNPMEQKWANLGKPWLDYEFEYSRHTFDTLYNSPVCTLESSRLHHLTASLNTLKSSQVKLNAFVSPMYYVNFHQLIRSKAYPDYLRFLEFCAGQTDFIFFGGSNSFTTDSAFFWDIHHTRNTLFEFMHPYFSTPKLHPDSTLWGILVTKQNFDALKVEIEKCRQKIL